MRDRPLIFGALALLLVVLTAPFWHGALANTHVAPAIPTAKGTHCVRPVAWMRKNHMRLLMRVRYEAVHEGIRSKDESLPGCMNCHVSKLADGTYPAVTSPKFFCNACHSYAGVSIDCFSCHTNRPAGEVAKAAEVKSPLFAAGDAKREAALAAQSGGAP